MKNQILNSKIIVIMYLLFNLLLLQIEYYVSAKSN